MSTKPIPVAQQGAASSRTGLDRRAFLAVALGLVGAAQAARAATPTLASTTLASTSNLASAKLGVSADTPLGISPGALLATLSDTDAAGWLGQRYLADHLHEQDVNLLIDRLTAAIEADQGRLPADSLALRQALVTLIEHEFMSGPLQPVDGWLLAPSEARLYALAALALASRQVDLSSDRQAPRPTASC